MIRNLWKFLGHQPSAKEILGQIRPMSIPGLLITLLTLDYKVRTIVEIGTWKGEGSTRAIANGLRVCNLLNQKPLAYSLEADLGMWRIASENHRHDTSGLTLLWGRIVSADDMDCDGLSLQEEVWAVSDRESLQKAPDVREMLPASIDLLILDGGEFSTRAEFEYLLPRIKRWVVLDDTNLRKTKGIQANLASGGYGSFRPVFRTRARNGFAIWLKL